MTWWENAVPRLTPARGVAFATGILGSVGIGLLLIHGDHAAAVLALLGAIALVVIVSRAFPSADRYRLLALVAMAYCGRLALLAVLHYALIAIGRGGFLFGDDYTYADLSWRLVQWLRGEDVEIGWRGEAYLFGNFVYLETAVFYVFGPQITIIKVLNTILATGTALFTFALARRWMERRGAYVAAGLTAFFPSLVLWSVLNLKDPIALFLVGLTIWAVTSVAHGTSSWRWLIVAVAAIGLLAEIRTFLFLVLGVVAPVALLLARGLDARRRVAYGGAVLLATGMLMAVNGYGFLGAFWLRPSTLELFELQRAEGAAGAKTAFNAPPDRGVPVRPGDRFVVMESREGGPVAAPSPGAPGTPRVVQVAPGTEIVLAGRGSPRPGTVEVRPGDIVVVPGEQPNDATVFLPLSGSGAGTRFTDANAHEGTVGRLLRYLPKGIAYALAAPFPWEARTASERVTIPEMVAWYPICLAAAIQAWRWRRHWRGMFALGAYVLLVFGVLALAEGNVGSLFRHRAMLLPFTFVVAAPALVAAWSTAAARLRPQRATAS